MALACAVFSELDTLAVLVVRFLIPSKGVGSVSASVTLNVRGNREVPKEDFRVARRPRRRDLGSYKPGNAVGSG